MPHPLYTIMKAGQNPIYLQAWNLQ